MSKNFFRRGLLILAIICSVAAVPAAVISLRAGYFMLVPRYSAVASFERLGFNLRLDLYLTGNEARDSGRYLSVIHGGSYHTRMIQGWDWAHRARNSIYRIDNNRIAVLSALGYDYIVTVTPFDFAPIGAETGDGWEYLGAFDFTFPANGRPRLNFFEPQVAECIPMGISDPATWLGKPRAGMRQANCPSPRPEQGVQ